MLACEAETLMSLEPFETSPMEKVSPRYGGTTSCTAVSTEVTIVVRASYTKNPCSSWGPGSGARGPGAWAS